MLHDCVCGAQALHSAHKQSKVGSTHGMRPATHTPVYTRTCPGGSRLNCRPRRRNGRPFCKPHARWSQLYAKKATQNPGILPWKICREGPRHSARAILKLLAACTLHAPLTASEQSNQSHCSGSCVSSKEPSRSIFGLCPRLVAHDSFESQQKHYLSTC